MVTKIRIVGLLLTAMVLSGPMVYAESGMGDKDSWNQEGGWHHGDKDHMIAKILNFSDDQVKQLKDIHQKQRDSMKASVEQIKSVRESLEAEIVKASPDMNKVSTIQAQLKTLLSQLVDDRLNSTLAVKKVLTPEQFAGYMALKKERKMIKHMMGHMMGHEKFDQKGNFCKLGDEHKHWGKKSDKDDDADDYQN